MSKLSNSAFNFVRKVFAREQQKNELAVPSRELAASSLSGLGDAQINVDGIGGVGEFLGLDRRMMHRFSDYEQMDEYGDISCLAGDSLVFTLKDGWKTIASLAETGKPFFVLAYDSERRSLVPAECLGAKKTGGKGHKKPMVRVVFDNGTSIRCTEDHLFLTKGEKWIEAGKLETGERLMPASVRLRHLNSEKMSSLYWQVYQPCVDSQITARPKISKRNDRWTWIHRLVAHEYIGDIRGKIAHHIDENSLNNEPHNIQCLCQKDHASIHLKDVDNTRFLPEWTDEKRRQMSEKMKGNTFSQGRKLSSDTKKKMSIAGRGKRKNEEWRRKIGKSQPNRIEFAQDVLEGALFKQGTIAGAARMLGVSWSTVKRNVQKYDLVVNEGNHRVAFIERLDTSEDVYDLSVPEYKNFVCNGVIVHNSALDIYADDATQVDTTTGRSVWVESQDKVVKEELEDMFWKRLRIEEHVWPMMRTLCKYGSDVEEIIVGSGGVQDLRYMPPATVRRVENNKSDLLGFVQSYGGDVTISPKEFEKMRTRTGAEVNKDKNLAVYEPWRVAHMRLLSKHRDSLYGWSITEPARWVWKRLMLLEDAVLVYKLCLHGDTNIWTSDGYKKIRDIEKGDEVYSYTTEDELKKTKVVYKKHNGQDVLYRVKSAHRELYANATHPILVETIIHNGSGSENGRRLDYVEVKDLDPNIHRLVTPSKEDELTEVVRLVFPDDWEGSQGISSLASVTAEFARWFGFVVGRGFVSIHPSTDEDGKTCLVHELGFRTCNQEDINQRYRSVFESFFGESTFGHNKTTECEHVGKHCVSAKHNYVKKYSIDSKTACEFMLLNGFVSGSQEKRIPGWVFKSPAVIRVAFLEGLVDACGFRKEGRVGTKSRRECYAKVMMTLFNDYLAEDVRELAMQTGYTVEKIYHCQTEWSYKRQPMTESLWEVEEVETDDIWDIGVEAEEHNFVANGIVVHNTRSPSRYAFYVDVGKLPRQEAERTVQDVMQRIKKKKFIDSKTGKLNLKFNPLPVAYDTLIPLGDGRTITISEMAKEHGEGKAHWVYSIDQRTGNLAPGEVEWVGQTRENAPAVKITFGDGGWAKMAPDHPVMKQDCTYVMAEHLKPNDLVMPFDRRMSEEGYGDVLPGLEMVYDPGDKRYRYTYISKKTGLNFSNQVVQPDSSDHRTWKSCRVVSVEEVESCDHYCMTVKHWHNFALVMQGSGATSGWSSGVFVKNSMDEDFFLAMREGRESTRVESLMGPSYQQVEDVQYFLHKLHAALKVPRAYLGYEESLPSKATLSAEDVRFARTVLRCQRELINGLKKVSKVNLAVRNIDPAAVDFEVRMAVPSSIFELGQMEVRRARADLASMMERHVSLNWILSKVYGLSDSEIEEIAGQKKNEQKAANAMGGGFEDRDTGGRVLTGNNSYIPERELFDGKREDEKRMEGMLLKAMKDPSNPVGQQLKETGMLLREILHSVRSS